MVHQLLHDREVVDADVIELGELVALEYDGGYMSASDSFENARAYLLVAEGVGHKKDSVKTGIIY